MENVVDYLFVIGLWPFLLHILVRFHLLQGKNFIFCGISTVVFLDNNSGEYRVVQGFSCCPNYM